MGQTHGRKREVCAVVAAGFAPPDLETLCLDRGNTSGIERDAVKGYSTLFFLFPPNRWSPKYAVSCKQLEARMRSGSTMPRQKKLSDSGKHVASVIHPAVTGTRSKPKATLLTQVSQWLVPADWRMNAQQRLHNRWPLTLLLYFYLNISPPRTYTNACNYTSFCLCWSSLLFAFTGVSTLLAFQVARICYACPDSCSVVCWSASRRR